MTRMVAVALLILVSSGGPHGAAAQEQKAVVGVAGVYLCEGQNPDGTAYKGIVEIVKFHDSFLVRWTLPEDVTVIGVGLESNGVFAVSYFGGAPGVIVYKAESGDRLLGQWTMGGTNGGVFSETLTRIAVQDLPQGAPVPSAPAEPSEPARPPARGVRL